MKTRTCSCPKCHAALQLLLPVPPIVTCLHCGARLRARQRHLRARWLRTGRRRIRIVPPPLPSLTLAAPPPNPPATRPNKWIAALVAVALLALFGAGMGLVFGITRGNSGGGENQQTQAPPPPANPPPARTEPEHRRESRPAEHLLTHADSPPSPEPDPAPELEPPPPADPPPTQLVAVPGIPGLSIPAEKQARIDRASAAGVRYLKQCIADIEKGKRPCEDLSNRIPKEVENDFKKVLGDRLSRPFLWRYVRLAPPSPPTPLPRGERGEKAPQPLSPEGRGGKEGLPANLVFGLNGTERPAVAERFLLEGYLALVGWTLLESGVPASDPTVRHLADRAREQVPATVDHFSVAVTLLFLDRLNDPRDRGLCRSCALRLVAAQSVRRDWTMIPLCCPLNAGDEQQLLALLRAAGSGKPKAAEAVELNAYLKLLPVCQALGGRTDRPPVTAPNQCGPIGSDNQFVQLALRAARRRGLPVQPSLKLLARRYRDMQQPSGAFDEAPSANAPLHGWTFGSTTWFTSLSFDRCWTRSLCCAALTGLALAEDDGKKLSKDGRLNTGDPVICRGFEHLLEAARGPPRQWGPWHGGADYYLWSEKVLADTYDLPRLGERDWYGEAADLLLQTQRPDGSWDDRFLPPPLATCFALMTLIPDPSRARSASSPSRARSAAE